MAQLDNRAAELFRKLSSLSCTLRDGPHVVDSRVPTIGQIAAQNGLQPFGLGFAELNILFEYGLIISDFNSYMAYAPAIVDNNSVALPFRYMNQNFGLNPKQALSQENRLGFHVSGVQLSRSGMELLGIVELEEDHSYSTALAKHFDNLGYTMVRIAVPGSGT